MTHLEIVTAVVIAQAVAIAFLWYDKPSSEEHWRVKKMATDALTRLAHILAEKEGLVGSSHIGASGRLESTHVITYGMRVVEVTPFEDDSLPDYVVERVCFAPKNDPRKVIRPDDVLLFCVKKEGRANKKHK